MQHRYDLKMPVLQGSLNWMPPNDEWDEHWTTASRSKARMPAGVAVVTRRSPESQRKAVRQLAVYFQREFHYDFIQYPLAPAPELRAYLWWVDDCGYQIVIGACLFDWLEYSNAPANWSMQWVWFHPFERRKGHLTEAWPWFRARFGEFDLAHPLSKAMGAFLKKREPSWASRYRDWVE